MGWNIWIFLFYYFGAEIAGRRLSKYGGYPQLSKIVLYPTMVIVLIYVWTIAATGRLGEMRWWPSRDRLSHLVPLSIKNATMIKCRWSLFFLSILSTLTSASSHPATSENSSSSSALIQSQTPHSCQRSRLYATLHRFRGALFLHFPCICWNTFRTNKSSQHGDKCHSASALPSGSVPRHFIHFHILP